MDDFKTKIYVAGIVFVIAAVLFSVGAQIFGNLQDQVMAYGTKINETFTTNNGTNVSLIHTRLNSGYTITYHNESQPIGSGNFTVDYVGGQVALFAANKTHYDTFHNRPMNITYEFENRTLQYNTTEWSNWSMEELSSWLPTLALVVIGGLMLGIIMFFFWRKYD